MLHHVTWGASSTHSVWRKVFSFSYAVGQEQERGKKFCRFEHHIGSHVFLPWRSWQKLQRLLQMHKQTFWLMSPLKMKQCQLFSCSFRNLIGTEVLKNFSVKLEGKMLVCVKKTLCQSPSEAMGTRWQCFLFDSEWIIEQELYSLAEITA